MDSRDEKFKVEQVMLGNLQVVLLNGVIDEDTDLSALNKMQGPLTFNFKGVTSINSCGVRNWVNFIKAIEGREISYEECPPLIVRQMNMVPSFTGQAQVRSVFVNYVCDKCEKEKWVLISSDEFKTGAKNIKETLPCDCNGKGEMEFDGHPKQYFAFSK